MDERPDRSSDLRASALDERLVLERLDDAAAAPLHDGEPIVTDIRGRVWRVRPRVATADWVVAVASAIVLVALVLAIASRL